MEYNQATTYLHTVQGENTIIGFNFTDEQEAKEFKEAVQEKLLVWQRREREEQRSKELETPVSPSNAYTINPQDFREYVDSVGKTAKRNKRNITKEDIPLCSPDEQLKVFFEKAGISKEQLQDRDTKEFIDDFIDQNGGREAIEESINLHSDRKAPAVPSFNQALPLPPRPHILVTPPPPPGLSPNAANSLENEKLILPPPGFGSPLLFSNKTETTLRPVEDTKVPTTPVDDSRGQLLKEIKEGMDLKATSASEDVKLVNNVPEPIVGGADLAEALAKALARRSKAMLYSSLEEEEEQEDIYSDSEWE